MFATKMLVSALVTLSVAACSGDDAPTSARNTTTALPSNVSPSPSPASSSSAKPRPVPATPVNGGIYFAVYLAAGDPTSADYKERVKLLESKSLPHEGIDVNCDQGASEGLAISDEEFVVGVYFKTRANADVWAKASQVEPVGIVQVTTACRG